MGFPSNPEAELGVIGCCLLGGTETALEAAEYLRPAFFTRDDAGMGAEVLARMLADGEPISLPSFAHAWSKLHRDRPVPQEIITAPDKVPSAANLPFYLGVLVDCCARRRLMYGATDLLNHAGDSTRSVDEVLAEAEATLAGEDLRSVEVEPGPVCANRLATHLEERYNLQGRRSGLVTNLGYFDQITDGLQFGEQTIIAARPSMGKTAIGLNILETVCLQNNWPALFVTLEMSTHSLMRRLLASWGRIPMNDLRSGQFVGDKVIEAKVASFHSLLSKAPLHVLNGVSGLDSARLTAAVRRVHRKHGIKLVVVDYLQKIRPAQRHEKRTYEVGEVSGALKAMAVQTGAALLTLAQLNREPEKDKGRLPRLSDLADSGQIERDADTVALLHRNRGDEGGKKAILIVAKQRDGEVGQVELDFDGRYCRFSTFL